MFLRSASAVNINDNPLTEPSPIPPTTTANETKTAASAITANGHKRHHSMDFYTSTSGALISVDFADANLLGRGRHARVYSATFLPSENNCHDNTHPSNSSVAVKFCLNDRESTAQGVRERSSLVQLKSNNSQDNIIPLIDHVDGTLAPHSSCPIEFRLALVLKLANHGSLANFIYGTSNHQLSYQRTPSLSRLFLQWTMQLFQGLNSIHQSGLVHLDIKPENILLDINQSSETNLYISDFGCTQPVNSSFESAGTTEYLAPELLASTGNRLVHHSADIYAAGVVIYAMLTGRRPFQVLLSGNHSGVQLILASRSGFFTRNYNPWTLRDLGSGYQTDPILLSLRDLANDCLLLDPHQRPTARQALDRLL